MTTQPIPADVLIDRDPRGRVSLARVSPHLADRYLARVEAGGVIVLEPAVVMTEAQARLNALPDLHERITESMRNPSRGVPYEPRRSTAAAS